MSDLHDLLPSPETVERVVHELRHGQIRIGVFGEFSSGKSTFLNALMGEDLLSVAVDPTTATPTRIIYARDFNVLVQGTFEPNGNTTELARLFTDKVPAWARFVGKSGILSVLRQEGQQIRSFLERWTKEGADAARTSAVVLCLPQPFLKDRLCLIDTPGANNEFTRHHQIAEQVATQVDIAVCLIDARQGGKRSECDFIHQVASITPKTILVINKIDCIDQEERDDVVASLHETLRSQWPADKGDCPEPWPCSAKAVLDADLATAQPALVVEFATVRQRLTDIAAAERGPVMLLRTGGLDRTLRILASEAERVGQLDIAHRALEECLNLYREAEIHDAALLAQFTQIEQALQANLPKLAEANALLDLAERKLAAQKGVATAEVRDAVLRATLIFRQMNQVDERLEKLRKQIEQTSAEATRATILSTLAEDIWNFEKSFPLPDGEKKFTESVSSDRRVIWQRAAEAGVAVAQFFTGICALHGTSGISKNETLAVDWLRKAAEQGFVQAQNLLGLAYWNGVGVTKDFAKAVYWLRKSADQGDAGAQNQLGLAYWNGNGVTQDFNQAVDWFSKAAEQGIAHAQHLLGVAYRNGVGVAQDFAQAVDWFRKAAEQGNTKAQNDLAALTSKGEQNQPAQPVGDKSYLGQGLVAIVVLIAVASQLHTCRG